MCQSLEAWSWYLTCRCVAVQIFFSTTIIKHPWFLRRHHALCIHPQVAIVDLFTLKGRSYVCFFCVWTQNHCFVQSPLSSCLLSNFRNIVCLWTLCYADIREVTFSVLLEYLPLPIHLCEIDVWQQSLIVNPRWVVVFLVVIHRLQEGVMQGRHSKGCKWNGGDRKRKFPLEKWTYPRYSFLQNPVVGATMRE